MTDYPVATSGIAAQAMEYLELRPLSSTADGSDDARAMARALPLARRMCLTTGDFAIASRTAKLSQATPDPSYDPKFDAAYTLPSDLLVIRDVFLDGIADDYRQQGQQLLTHSGSEVVCRYSFDETRENVLPPHLQQAIALQTALLMTDLRSTSTSKKEALARQLDDAMMKARRDDRGSASPDRYDEWPDQTDWASEATW